VLFLVKGIEVIGVGRVHSGSLGFGRVVSGFLVIVVRVDSQSR
jgi:hypothetical protein